MLAGENQKFSPLVIFLKIQYGKIKALNVKIPKLKSSLYFLILLTLLILPVAVFAQESSPSSTPTPSSQSSPAPSPSSSPASSSQSSTPTPSLGATNSADSGKQQVLGAATELGNTSRGIELAKWLIATILGVSVFILGIKLLRSDAQE